MGAEAFSNSQKYRELNRQFIQSTFAFLNCPTLVVDLACGNGLLMELFLGCLDSDRHNFGEGQSPLKLLGVEISPESLQQAAKRLTSLQPQLHLPAVWTLLNAVGDHLSLPANSVDLLLLGNAIHCFSDKEGLIAEIGRVLHKGGVIAFNSAFYAGSILSDTEALYQEWMKQAVFGLMRREEAYRQQGGQGSLRSRKRGRPAFSNRWLTPAEYAQALAAGGFRVASIVQREVPMTAQDFVGISARGGTWEKELAEILLGGYPVEIACEVLADAVQPAFETVNVTSVPRFWLEIIATKDEI